LLASLRQGNANIGTMVSCAANVDVYEFLDRLISVASLRVRDFRGISAKAFDGRAEITRSGIREQLIFPEIDFNKAIKKWISLLLRRQNDEQKCACFKGAWDATFDSRFSLMFETNEHKPEPEL